MFIFSDKPTSATCDSCGSTDKLIAFKCKCGPFEQPRFTNLCEKCRKELATKLIETTE